MYKFQRIIREYRAYVIENPDTWLIHCKKRRSLTEAIKCAAESINHKKKRHPHQYRLIKEDLSLFANALLIYELEINDCQDFDELFVLVEKIGATVKGIGEMLIYDTAERIGCFKNVEPENIYLHAGTRKGAEILLNKKLSKKIKYISRDLLPETLNNPSLSCSQLEDILCMYKHKFKD